MSFLARHHRVPPLRRAPGEPRGRVGAVSLHRL